MSGISFAMADECCLPSALSYLADPPLHSTSYFRVHPSAPFYPIQYDFLSPSLLARAAATKCPITRTDSRVITSFFCSRLSILRHAECGCCRCYRHEPSPRRCYNSLDRTRQPFQQAPATYQTSWSIIETNEPQYKPCFSDADNSTPAQLSDMQRYERVASKMWLLSTFCGQRVG